MALMMMALAPDYGRRIRLRRQALSMSQKELGALVGKSESAVISWEKHRHAPVRSQGAIEAVLGISLDDVEAPAPDPGEKILMELDLKPAEREQLLRVYQEIRAGRRNSA